MKTLKVIRLPLLLAVASVLLIFWELETWQQHQENIFAILWALALPVICGIQLIRGAASKDVLRTVAWGAALLVGCWVFKTQLSIPNCLECNGGVNSNDLGWMVRYFQ